MTGRPHQSAPATRRRRAMSTTAGAGVTLALLLPTTAVGGPGDSVWSAVPAAAASDLTVARQRATALRKDVARLELAADVAVEDYLTAAGKLDRATSAYISARRTVGDAQASSDDAELAAGRRARALYIAGGPVALYASVLAGGDMREVVDRAQTVQRLVDADHSLVTARHQAVAYAAADADRLELLAGRRTRLQRRTAAAADRVAVVLARQRTLLSTADEDVRRLAEEQRRREEAAAARAAAAALAAAQQRQADAARAAAARGIMTQGAAGTTAGTTAIAAAASVLGRPYVWAADGPSSFDCSGLTGWAYAHAGVSLPRTSRQQWHAGRRVSLGQLAPGDLLFWAYDTEDPATIHHVGVYIGDGEMIHAPHTGDVVKVAGLWMDGYIGAVRPDSSAS